MSWPPTTRCGTLTVAPGYGRGPQVTDTFSRALGGRTAVLAPAV